MPRLYMRYFRTRGVYANYPAFRRVIRREFTQHIGPGLAATSKKQVAHWKKSPDFEIHHTTTARGIEVGIEPTGSAAKVWWWHVKGVAGRTIRPRSHYRFKSMTRVGRKGRELRKHKRGRYHWPAALKFTGRDGSTVFRYSVRWKGIKPRDYPGTIAKSYRPEFLRRIENAARRGVRAAQKEGK